MHGHITCPSRGYPEAHSTPCTPFSTPLPHSLSSSHLGFLLAFLDPRFFPFLFRYHRPPARHPSLCLSISPTMPEMAKLFHPLCAAHLFHRNRSSKSLGALLCLLSTSPAAPRTVPGIQRGTTIRVFFKRAGQLCWVLLEAPEGSLIATWCVRPHHSAASLGRVAGKSELGWVSQDAQLCLWKPRAFHRQAVFFV